MFCVNTVCLSQLLLNMSVCSQSGGSVCEPVAPPILRQNQNWAEDGGRACWSCFSFKSLGWEYLQWVQVRRWSSCHLQLSGSTCHLQLSGSTSWPAAEGLLPPGHSSLVWVTFNKRFVEQQVGLTLVLILSLARWNPRPITLSEPVVRVHSWSPWPDVHLQVQQFVSVEKGNSCLVWILEQMKQKKIK